MPEYVYRAVTEKGQIVRNRVEDVSKNTLIKRLKSNNLMPISVSQVGYRSVKKHKSRKRNVTDIDELSAEITKGLEIVYVENMDEVLKAALTEQ